jgi:broad specificity phosphatase PhoE
MVGCPMLLIRFKFQKNILVDENGNPRQVHLWTSSMRRTIKTASYTLNVANQNFVQHRVWRLLDEIYAGKCDGLYSFYYILCEKILIESQNVVGTCFVPTGMTYEQIEKQLPEEFSERKKNKLGHVHNY